MTLCLTLLLLLTVVCLSVLKMFGNWTFGTLVFTVMVITVTLKVHHTLQSSLHHYTHILTPAYFLKKLCSVCTE